MDMLMGLAMIVLNVWGTIIVFGGAKETAKWLRIIIGIVQIIVLLICLDAAAIAY